MTHKRSVYSRVLLLFCVLGSIDAIYLTAVHFQKSLLVCPDSGIINCTQVLTSALSTIGGVPISILGLLWFIGLAFMVVYKPKNMFVNIWLIIGAGGLAYSLIGMSIIGKICIYCSILDTLIILSIIASALGRMQKTHERI